jgi:hypothetical protein
MMESSRTHTTPIPPKQKAQGDACCFGGGGGVVCLQVPELPAVPKIVRLQDHLYKKGADTIVP